ncbi:ImmA/IrrE family metallo-endopeptidase, partial [Marinilactibacillus psychrotolerans]
TPKGETVRFKQETLILINESLIDKNERYFVLAHELYHAIEHNNLSAYYTTQRNGKGTLEREASTFAGHLMINQYKEEYGYLPETFQVLRDVYGVPENLELYLAN